MTREPSMEEILSSIRRVIARDEQTMSGRAAPDDGAFADDQPAAAHEISTPDDVLELTQASPHAAEGPSDSDVTDEGGGGALLSQTTEDASRQSIAALAAAIQNDAPAAAAPAGDMTINAMVESMLRPMLRDWLDSNLPPLVERLVAREIARITGTRL